jgi:DNA-binding MarR family transcriptional regulator
LEDAGLVTRITDPDDGRATLATITDDGRAALRRAAPVYLAGIEEHFTRHITEREQRVITRGLQRVVDAHEAAIDPRR